MKRIFKTIFVLIAVSPLLVSCDSEGGAPVAATGIEVTTTPDPMVLSVGGEPGKIDARLLPADVTDKRLVWEMDPEGVVELATDGTVTPILPGVVTVTVGNVDPDPNPDSNPSLSSVAFPMGPITENVIITVNTVLNDAQIEFNFGADSATADVKMLQVSFATGMPPMDITVPGVTVAETAAGAFEFLGEGIIPTTVMGGNTIPVAMYTITGFSGEIDETGKTIAFEMMCGTYPISYAGSRGGTEGAFTGTLTVSPAVVAVVE